MAVIGVLGTLDTKAQEHAFVAEQIRARGHRPLLIDVGTGPAPQVAPDITREEVAQAGGIDLPALAARGDRGECVAAMSVAAPKLLEWLQREGRIAGVISLGGGGGTAIATAAMRALPIGFPKLMVSTLAAGNTAHYVGTKDIVMLPSIVDVAGLNRISRTILTRAAGAICGMVEAVVAVDDARPLIVASMFGNTTACLNAAVPILEAAGYEVLVFHATGAGGRTMESLIESGLVAGVLDITTTEWADELVGGVLSAGPHRLEAAGRAGVPAVVVPGCLDMVNFGEPTSVPEKFRDRTFYAHNPQVTLMRTNVAECNELGRILATKINAYTAPVTVLLPRQGISVISAPGGPFHDPAADAALFDALAAGLRDGVQLQSHDRQINAPAFAQACAEALLRNIVAARSSVRR
ncbi:MAG: Tm-1-like ATP-binding domain-containing protein [Planctomycetales bacterium]|nr:Tm-1-like ATP-binding domain-containing protein [Planctomycetales bacterium]MBN8626421.1 Tm-1-like ATP-binding domain-containing protein [Planctomycetota bacterium]